MPLSALPLTLLMYPLLIADACQISGGRLAGDVTTVTTRGIRGSKGLFRMSVVRRKTWPYPLAVRERGGGERSHITSVFHAGTEFANQCVCVCVVIVV